MAKTAAEYQRAYRQRKAERAKAAGDPSDAIAATTFDKAFREAGFEVAEESLASVGIDAPTFDADTDDQWREEWGVPYRGSIGRAERMVGALLDAATELSTLINRYKREQIRARFEEVALEQATDETHKKKIGDESVRLIKMEQQLEKEVRWTFLQWKVTDV